LHRPNLPAHFDDGDLELLVRKTLIFVARGCDRMSALSSNPTLAKLSSYHNKSKANAPSSINYVYNYLPPGDNVLKLFSFIADEEAKQARVFVPGNHFLV
jgi:hypothetical protein